jgi:hypothetical protein
LEDKLKRAEERIKELKADLDEANKLVEEEREFVEDADAMIEQWIGAFDMVLDDNGSWTWPEDEEVKFLNEGWDRYQELQRKWNKFVPEYNGMIYRLSGRMREIGRPLAASEAQCAAVLRLREAGGSLRGIAKETGLGLRTVRTIIGRKDGTDRTSKQTNMLRRRELDKARIAAWRARRRARAALPKRINTTLQTGENLIKAAKGLGKR